MTPRLKLKAQLLLSDEIAFGPGKAQLMEAIRSEGSISAAARHMGLSYRRAWLMIDVMNRCFAKPLVSSVQGGARGGGARLTEDGEAVLMLYRELETALEAAAADHIGALTARLSK